MAVFRVITTAAAENPETCEFHILAASCPTLLGQDAAWAYDSPIFETSTCQICILFVKLNTGFTWAGYGTAFVAATRCTNHCCDTHKKTLLNCGARPLSLTPLTLPV